MSIVSKGSVLLFHVPGERCPGLRGGNFTCDYESNFGHFSRHLLGMSLDFRKAKKKKTLA